MASSRFVFLCTLLGLNTLLWLPAIWRRSDQFTLFPLPEHHLARGFYDIALFYGARRSSLDFGHVFFDFILLLSLALLGSRFVKRDYLAKILSMGFMLSLSYQIYQELLLGFRGRLPLFREDLSLIQPTLHFLGDSLGSGLWPALIGSIALAFIVYRSLIWVWESLLGQIEAMPSKWPFAALIVGLLCYAQLPFYKYGPDLPDTVIRSSLYSTVSNAKRSFRDPVVVQAPLPSVQWEELISRNPPLLSELPDIYLFVVESYGQVVYEDPEMKDRHQAHMQKVEADLSRSGWAMRTQISQAPVFGGGSWLSLATMHNGTWIPNQESYDSLDEATKTKSHMVGLMESWGYETLGLMPANRHEVGTGGQRTPAYGYQEMLEWKDIPYQGSPTNYAWIPDQYSLGWTFANKPLPTDRPRLFFFMSTNSHTPWKGVPPMTKDWRELDSLKPEEQKHSVWTSFVGNLKSALELTQQKNVDRSAYLDTISYEWDVIAENIQKLSKRPSLIVVVGDHQPYFADPAQWGAPVHILTKDPRMLGALDKAGFGSPEAGLTWKHDEISRLILGLVLKDPALVAQNSTPSRQSMTHPPRQAH